MVCIPDCLGKQLLHKHGFHIPRGLFTASMNEANMVKTLDLPLLVKPYHPYMPVRHESGEYKAYSYKEAIDIIHYFLRADEGNEIVSRLYVEEEIRLTAGYRFMIRITAEGMPQAVLYRLDSPDSVLTREIDYLQGFSLWEAEEFWAQAGVSEEYVPVLSLFAEQCYKQFVNLQLTYLDIGDFAVENNRVIVKKVNMNIDDYTLLHHSGPLYLEGFPLHVPRRPLTAAEQSVAEINETERNRGWVHYVELTPDSRGIAVCFGGTGLSLMMADYLYDNGIQPANWTDLSSGVSEKKLVALLTAILNRPDVRMLWMVINFFQFSRVDVYASALVSVMKQLRLDPFQFPIVVRLTGPGAKGAHEILRSVPGIHFYTDDIPFEEMLRLAQPDYIARGGAG